jgi:hypothetical protein
MNKVYLYPSFYAHIINGLLLLLSFILLCNNYSKIIKLSPYNLFHKKHKIYNLLQYSVGTYCNILYYITIFALYIFMNMIKCLI